MKAVCLQFDGQFIVVAKDNVKKLMESYGYKKSDIIHREEVDIAANGGHFCIAVNIASGARQLSFVE